MGTTGPNIFDDDLACDLRVEFRELIGDGLSAEHATERMLTSWAGSIGDPDEGPTFWIALAAVQWKCGRLQEHVKNRACEAIDSGTDLQRWDETDPKSRAARVRILQDLRTQLLSPQPKPTRIAKIYRDRTDWEIGHLVGYRLTSGRLIIFRIIGIDEGNKRRTPIVDICDWVGEMPPPPTGLAGMPRRRTRHFERSADPASRRWNDEHDGKLSLIAFRPKEFPADRLTVIATGQKVAAVTSGVGVSHFGGWTALDAFLKNFFELE